MQDRPTSTELLEAAQAFCERDLIPNLTGRVAFHARVLRNVLGILERELAGEEEALRSELQRLEDLLGDDGAAPDSVGELKEVVKTRNTALSQRIRSGELDDRFDEVLDAVYQTVTEKLAIANPRYSSEA
jgi:hypothetical protein